MQHAVRVSDSNSRRYSVSVPIERTTIWGMTAPVAGLCLASHFVLPVLVGRWLKSGAVVDAPDDFGQTPLLYAVKEGNDAVVQRLLDAGAGVDVSGDTGRTPLSYASVRGHDAVVLRLLDAGAGVDAPHDSGRIPL